jgi:hypothetical protein
MSATTHSQHTHTHTLRPRRRPYWVVLILLSLAAATTSGCDVLEAILSGEATLSGQNAFVYLQRADDRVPTTNIQAVMKVMDLRGAKGDSTASVDAFEPGDDAIDLMRKTARARQNIQTDKFNRIPFPIPKDAPRLKDADMFPAPNLGAMKSEHLIPTVNQIPVRDQAYRGTCAAFAGIGAIEYAAVKQYGLSSLDLSEQRFYFNSKPECQSGSCSQNDEGSWYGDGMDASVAAPSFDIPLESDCPYVSDFQGNDVQAPQGGACSNGALKISQYTNATTPQEIVNALEDGFAVPFASPLSLNWESNSGLITLSESGYTGNTSHSGGHAYLIVGYRLLPDRQDEGGMCFVIKNSWGTGWGVNGYSCMTLAWLQKWNFDYAFEHPVPRQVQLRDDVVANNGGGGGGQWDGGGTNDDTVGPNVDPLPDPSPNDLSWTNAYLYGPDDQFYRGQTAEADGNLYVRGVLSDGRTTGFATLQRSGADVLFEGEVVGAVNNDEVTLCTERFDPLCSLRLNSTDNSLYVEFLNSDMRKVSASEVAAGNWSTLPLPLAGYSLEFFAPDDATALLSGKFYARLNRGDGVDSEPVRFSLAPTGDIKLMGSTIGNFIPGGDLGLCTGVHKNSCAMFGNQKGLQLIPNW